MIKRLLFKLHLIRSYPIFLRGLDGSKIPANMIRTDGKSYDIKPDLPNYQTAKMNDKVYIMNGTDPIKRVDLTGLKAEKNIHFDVYTPPDK